MFKCKICGKTYTDLPGIYSHIEKKHSELVPKNMTVPQYYYFMKTGKTNGNCVMCKQPTTWNKNTSKYNRFCTNPACKEKYVAEFKKRMIAKYGKVHLLNDPAKQREMLANRRISGKYRWADGTETVYTGSFELDLLKLLDLFMEWDPVDISMPSPHTYTYMYEGEEHYYIPDAFIHSLDLEIEVKDGGDNPNMHHKIRDVDKVKEKLKDEVLMSQKSFHYIKITNKNYTNFFNFLKKAKEGFAKYEDEKKMPRIFLIEDIKTKSTNTKTLYESTGFEVEDNEEIADSYNININREDYQQVKEFAKGLEVDVLVTESFVDNLTKTIEDLSKLSVFDLEELVMLNFNAKKNDPEAIKKYLKKLIKSCRTEKDMVLVGNLMKMYITYSEKLSKDDPTKKALEVEYKTWVMGEYQKEFNKKWKKITESFDYIEYQEEDILKEGRMGISELESAIYYDYDTMKGSNKRVQKYIFRVLKGCKTKKDLSIVKKLISMHKSYLSIEASKGNKKFIEMENDFRIWVKTNFTPELEKKSSVIKESVEIEDFEILEEGLNLPIPNMIKKVINKKLDNFASISDKDIDKTKLESYRKIVRDDVKKGVVRVGDELSMYKDVINKAVKDDLYQLKEGAISFSKLNDLLADKDHKRLAKYMDDYESFYKKTLKENPTKSENINTEITRARKYIEDLGRTGKVNNDLVKYAVERIDHSGLCVRPRMESAGIIASLSVVIGADTKRKSFGLNDTESKIFVNDNYSIRRPDTVNSMNCILCPDNLEENIQGKRVFKYEVKINNGGIELGDIIDRYSTDTVSIPGLFNLNEANNCKFIKDVCFQLGLTDCELELVSDTVY